jgi:hypothetical protein
MRRGYQLSLFGGGPGKGFLFDRRLVEQYLSDHAQTHLPDEARHARTIRQWVDAIRTTEATETSLEPRFINDILCGVLGYKSFPAREGDKATVYHKPSQRLTQIDRTPDAMLGEFTGTEARFTAVVELKSPGVNLDLPQPGYENETPVDQGFHYGSRILGVRWVLVSDMRVLRLYSVESYAVPGKRYRNPSLHRSIRKSSGERNSPTCSTASSAVSQGTIAVRAGQVCASDRAYPSPGRFRTNADTCHHMKLHRLSSTLPAAQIIRDTALITVHQVAIASLSVAWPVGVPLVHDGMAVAQPTDAAAHPLKGFLESIKSLVDFGHRLSSSARRLMRVHSLASASAACRWRRFLSAAL